MHDHLNEVIQSFPELHVLVIGEAATDVDLTGSSNRVAREAPVPIVEVEQIKRVPGRAGNAAVNIAQLGAQTDFLSVVGNDPEAEKLQEALSRQGVSTAHILVDSQRQTQTIERVMAGGHLLVRFDRGSTEEIKKNTETRLIQKLRRLFPRVDAVLVSDYGYGIMTPRVIDALAKLQTEHQKTLVIDSKYLDKYKAVGATVVKPNYQEALSLLGITRPAAAGAKAEQLEAYKDMLLERTGAEYVAATLDIDGSVVFQQEDKVYRTYSRPVDHSKAIGAGDTYSAALTLGLAAGASITSSAEIAQAAAITVAQKSGTVSCHLDELLQLFRSDPKHVSSLAELQALVETFKADGRKIVFTNGCFDILHSGHVSYLNQARAQGDVLIVGLNTDNSVKRLKGAERPINSLKDRIRTLSGLSAVDLITSFEEDTPVKLLKVVKPDLYVKGGDYTRESLPETPVVESFGGKVAILPYVLNRSTTNLISRIRSVTGKVTGGSADAANSQLGQVH